jgi:hypothetical protein
MVSVPFADGAVTPAGLFLGALAPTIVAALAFAAALMSMAIRFSSPLLPR